MTRSLALTFFIALLGCGGDDRPVVDASLDVSTDVAADSAADSGGGDGGGDSGGDSATDAADDSGADSGEDSGEDAGEDSGEDAAMDANVDAMSDSGSDADGGPDAMADGVNCDKSMVRCRIPEPICDDLEVPEITPDGSCYTLRCVPIGMCVCEMPSQCSNELLYTCRRDTGRCTPPL